MYLWPCCNDIGGIDLQLEETIDRLVLIDEPSRIQRISEREGVAKINENSCSV